mmetsp:Transcript_3748/g.12392  ORF Transcript_3748/g.12392 Transcript_3748/m.12392 type:complete len:284 (-) Transcript_3748:1528-2379(-)
MRLNTLSMYERRMAESSSAYMSTSEKEWAAKSEKEAVALIGGESSSDWFEQARRKQVGPRAGHCASNDVLPPPAPTTLPLTPPCTLGTTSRPSSSRPSCECSFGEQLCAGGGSRALPSTPAPTIAACPSLSRRAPTPSVPAPSPPAPRRSTNFENGRPSSTIVGLPGRLVHPTARVVAAPAAAPAVRRFPAVEAAARKPCAPASPGCRRDRRLRASTCFSIGRVKWKVVTASAGWSAVAGRVSVDSQARPPTDVTPSTTVCSPTPVEAAVDFRSSVTPGSKAR